MSSLMLDVRQALRQMRKSPAFFCIVVLTLGLGIGANTAMFSLVDWLVLRSLPIQQPEQMHFLVFARPGGNNEVQFSYPEFTEIQKQTTDLFSGMTPFIFGGLEGPQNAPDGLTVDGVTKPIQAVFVGSNFFALLGITPAHGRSLLSSEGKVVGADPVVILSYNYWQTRFGGDRAIVGRNASVNGHPVTIVGVTPKGFVGPTPLVEAQAYLPLSMYGIERGVAGDFLENPKTRTMVAFARVKAGTSTGQMQSELAVIGKRLLNEYPRDGGTAELRANRLRPPGLLTGAVNPLPKLAALFLILAALVLGLACVNVANLFLVRTFGRQHEMAIRAALGAGNGRLVRQLLTESLMVASLGCGVGVLLGVGATLALSAVPTESDFPFVLNFEFNWHVFLYAFIVAAVSAMLVMLVPAIRVCRGDLRDILHEGGRSVSSGRQRLRTVLVAGEVAACLTLLVISGLFVRSLRSVQNADLGFRPQSVLNMTLDCNEIGYTEAQGRAFYSAVLERTRALAGVQSASLASALPLGDNIPGSDLLIPGFATNSGQPTPRALYAAVSPDYFETMGMTLLRGRGFTAADNERSAPVAIINQAMADRYWPGQDPLGRSFANADDPKHPATIVGIVRNLRMGQLYDPYDSVYFRPLTQSYQGVATLQIKSPRGTQELVPEIREIVESLSPSIPIYGVRTMNEAIHGGNGLLPFELGASLAASMGALGLVLALVGVYGLTSYSVTQRTQEIGIRMALGAQRPDVLRVMVREGFFVTISGLAVGLVVAFTVGRLVGDFLVGITPTDPVTYVGVSALLATIVLLATFVPARRASGLNPIVALRHE